MLTASKLTRSNKILTKLMMEDIPLDIEATSNSDLLTSRKYRSMKIGQKIELSW